MLTQSKLIKFCNSIFKKLGMDDEKANDTSEILVEADMMAPHMVLGFYHFILKILKQVI